MKSKIEQFCTYFIATFFKRNKIQEPNALYAEIVLNAPPVYKYESRKTTSSK